MNGLLVHAQTEERKLIEDFDSVCTVRGII
jgi:hypothetical protein